MPHEIADVQLGAANPGPVAGAIYLPFWQLAPEGAAEAPRPGRPPSATAGSRRCTTWPRG